MKKIYFIAMAAFFSVIANAQPFTVLKDIYPGLPDGIYNGGPHKFTKMNGVFYFVADDGLNGFELWKSDGTAGGTVLIKDISPGPSPYGSYPSEITVVGNTLYFQAVTDEFGFELWKSDGTAAGTVIVKDINVGGSSGASGLTAIGNILYFSADDGIHGRELWKTNGTAAGTVMVRDAIPGPAGSSPSLMTRVGNLLFFTAWTPGVGRELWKSNGTSLGTVLVKDITPGPGDTEIRELVDGGWLLFVASPPGEVVTLMRSDGTEGGTIVMQPGLDGVNGLLKVGSHVVFAAWGGELWKTNGTSAGTELIKDIHPDPSVIKRILSITKVNNTVFFSGDDGVHGHELWFSDGTYSGTYMVKDIYPGPTPSSPDARQMYAVDNTLLFSADDGTLGRELWRSDGTCGGTMIVQDIYPGPVGSDPHEIIRVNDKIFVSAMDMFAGFEVFTGKLKKNPYAKSAEEFTEIVSEKPTVGLYPNPVHENATLAVNATQKGKLVCNIIDQQGRIVHTRSIAVNEGHNIISMEMRSFSSGVYTAVLSGSGVNSQIRFIKQ